MEIKNSFYKIFAILLFAIVSIASAYSAGGLNVILSSQDPDPVSPGNFVYVNVKISNSGSSNLDDVSIEMVEDENFKVAQGSEISRDLGIIPAYSSLESSKNFVIAKYKVLVDNKTPLGLNTIEFIVTEGGREYVYDFDILVADSNPLIRVSDFKITNVEAGKEAKLIVEVVNDNSVSLSDIIISLDLDSVEGKVFSIVSGSNQKIIGVLNAGEKKGVEYNIVVSPEASAKPYIVPVLINYEDALGNSYDSEGLGSILVYSKPLLSLKLDSQSSFSGGNNRVTFAISNPGTSTIKGTQIEILNSENYEIIEGQYQYVGDLNPDDFQTVQSQLYIKSEDDFNVLVKVRYLDSYNTLNEDVVEVPIKVLSNSELKELGLAKAESGSAFSSILVFLFVVALIVGAYIFGKKRGLKKAKSK